MRVQFHIVTDRSAFFTLLDAAIAETARLLMAHPTDVLLPSFAKQLGAMKSWTANGRKPSFDERRSISMGTTAQRELAGATRVEWAKYVILLTELDLYFKLWRSDAGLQTLDQSDWRLSFPADYDISDE
jgi:hypothetical protein